MVSRALISFLTFLIVVMTCLQAVAQNTSLVLQESDPYSFGDVLLNTSKTAELHLKNQGQSQVNIFEVFVGFAGGQINFLDKDYPGTGGTCADVLNSGDSCTLVFAYTGKKIGVVQSEIKINYFVSGVLQKLIFTLQGNSVDSLPEPPPQTDPAFLIIHQTGPFSFGQVGKFQTKAKEFKISNIGGESAKQFRVLPLAKPFFILDSTCGEEVLEQTSCTVTVSFSPESKGVHAASLELSYVSGNILLGLQQSIEGIGQ